MSDNSAGNPEHRHHALFAADDALNDAYTGIARPSFRSLFPNIAANPALIARQYRCNQSRFALIEKVSPIRLIHRCTADTVEIAFLRRDATHPPFPSIFVRILDNSRECLSKRHAVIFALANLRVHISQYSLCCRLHGLFLFCLVAIRLIVVDDIIRDIILRQRPCTTGTSRQDGQCQHTGQQNSN